MKKMIVAAVCVLIAFSATAQRQRLAGKRSSAMSPVEAAQVPDVVKKAQETAFPGIAVTRWEYREATGKKENTVSRYVAIFKQGELRARARYQKDGAAVSSSKYFGPKTAPEVITKALSRYPDFELVSGSQTFVSKSSKTFYRVRMTRGTSRLIVYLDEAGNEVTKDKAPAEATDDDDGEDN